MGQSHFKCLEMRCLEFFFNCSKSKITSFGVANIKMSSAVRTDKFTLYNTDS